MAQSIKRIVMLLLFTYSEDKHDELLDDPRYQLLIVGQDFSEEALSQFEVDCDRMMVSGGIEAFMNTLQLWASRGVSTIAFLPTIMNQLSMKSTQLSHDFKETLTKSIQIVQETIADEMPMRWCVFMRFQEREIMRVMACCRMSQQKTLGGTLESESVPMYRLAPYQLCSQSSVSREAEVAVEAGAGVSRQKSMSLVSLK